jgi:peptidoglycan/LPS O-acetylase OafA/YrhL
VAPTARSHPEDSAPDESRLPHRRALDGVRGVAVVGVLLFHAGLLEGGYLGVDLFFVLSGYLITSLLLAEVGSTGSIGLLGFWARRARRLLPALFLVLAFVGLYAAVIADAGELERIRADAFATLAYVANWRFVFGGFDYFALFTAPSPLNHTWSLAIEEQFYLVWPLVVLGVIRWGHLRGRGGMPASGAAPRRVFFVSVALAAMSAAVALGLWFRTENATRVYYGTDTRAASILFGAALGAFLMWRGQARSARMQAMIGVAGLLGAVVLAAAWSRLAGVNLYRGGLLACGLAGTAVIAAAAHPRPGLLGRALSFAPFVGLGLISYGLYLWHWPIFLWLDADRVGLDGWALFAVRMAVTLPIAIASFLLVEQPIRRGAFGSTTWRWATPVAAAALVVVTLVTTAGYEPPVSTRNSGITDPVQAARLARAHPGSRRLMVVGNSVGFFLAGEGFDRITTTPWLGTLNSASWACIYPVAERLRIDDFGRGQAPPPCDANWSADARSYRPDVVLMVFGDSGAGQYLHDGSWLVPCDPAFRTWYRESLARATKTFTDAGARVVMTSGPHSEVFGVSDASRDQTDCKNAQTAEFAHSHPGVAFIDLARYVCPTRERCRSRVDGVTLRKDGVHFQGPAARRMARWFLPQLGFDPPPRVRA